MKCSRIESVEDAFERVMGWNSVAELKKTSQPVTAFPAECRNLLPIFSATYDRTQCDDDNIEQLMFGGLKSQSQSLGGVFAKKTSLGVRKPRHARGRLLSRFSTWRTWLCEILRKSVPLGKYWRIRPLVFSFVPR